MLSVEFSTTDNTDPVDTVYSYACETLSLGLLYSELRDAIKEGDGNRVMLVWKFLLLIKFSRPQNVKNMLLRPLHFLFITI